LEIWPIVLVSPPKGLEKYASNIMAFFNKLKLFWKVRKDKHDPEITSKFSLRWLLEVVTRPY